MKWLPILVLIPSIALAGPTVLPSTPTVTLGNTIQFGTTEATTWSMYPGSKGSITSGGLFTAPSALSYPAAKKVVAGCPVVSDDNIYVVDITSLPVDANSATRISNVGTTGHFDFTEAQMPINVMDNTTPAISGNFFYTTNSNGLAYPVTPTPYRSVENALFPNDFFAQDRHQLGVNIDSCSAVEIYNNYNPGTATIPESCPTCNAQSGVQYPGMSYKLADAGNGGGSIDAAGAWILPTLITYDELKAGHIDHVLRMTLANGFMLATSTWPGTNFAGACGSASTCFPFGARLRLKRSYDDSGLLPYQKIVTAAMKKYGILIDDNGQTQHIQSAMNVFADSSTYHDLDAFRTSGPTLGDCEQVNEQSLMISSFSARVKLDNGFRVVPDNYAVVIASKSASDATLVYIALQPVTVGWKNPAYPANSAALSVMAGTPQFQIPYWVRGATDTSVSCTMSPTYGTLTSGCLYTAPTSVPSISSAIITITPTGVVDSTAAIQFPLVLFSSDAIRVDIGGKAGTITSPVIPYDAKGNYGPDANGAYWWSEPVGYGPSWYGLDDNSSPQASWIVVGSTDVGLDYTQRHGVSDQCWSAMVPNGNYTLTLKVGNSDANQIVNSSVTIDTQGNTVMTTTTPWITGFTPFQPTDHTFNLSVTDNKFYFCQREVVNGNFPFLGAWKLAYNSALQTNPTLSLVDSGSGITETVTVESSGLFRLVFEAGDNWGLSQWYDLFNDPMALTNLAGPFYAVNGPSEPCLAEPGLQNITFYGDTDKKLFMREAGCNFPTSPRAFRILYNSPAMVVVQSSGTAMDATPRISTSTFSTVTYYILPTGKIYVHKIINTAQAIDLGSGGSSDLFVATMGLDDPTQTGNIPPDTQGWIRASKTQNPYEYVDAQEDYVFAYWGLLTPTPYTTRTKASIMEVPSPNNSASLRQIIHSWSCGTGCGSLRWGYRQSPGPNMSAGQTVTYDFLMQLGTQGSSVLPDITTSAVADPIANAYIANPSFPDIPSQFQKESMKGTVKIKGSGVVFK